MSRKKTTIDDAIHCYPGALSTLRKSHSISLAGGGSRPRNVQVSYNFFYSSDQMSHGLKT